LKKATRWRSWGAPSVSLFKDDLDLIIEIISGKWKEIGITSGEYEYDSLDELEKHQGKEIKDLHIRGSLPGSLPIITVSFSWSGGTSLEMFGDDRAGGEFLRVKALLSDRRKIISYPLNPYIWWPLYLVCSIALVIAKAPLVYFFLSQIAFVALLVISTCIHYGFLYSITLSRRHERESFWSRNKDKVIVAIIAAVVSALATWLVSNLKW